MNQCYKISLICVCMIASAILARAETDQDFLKKCSEEKISAENRIEYCTKALEGEVSIVNKVAIYNNRGIAYRELKQYLHAINDHNKAIELDPKFVNVYNSRGNTYFQAHKYNKAIEDYNKAIELAPKYAHAYNDRGMAYCSLKQYGRALKDYTRAIEFNPADSNYYNGRGNVYYFLRDYAKAITDYTRSIEINPKYANAYYNRCFAHCYNLNQYDKALDDCSKAIELEPTNADSFHGRGIIYCYLEQFDKALEDFTKAISLDPKNTDSYSTRGIVHYLTNKMDKSDADFKKADELFGENIKTEPVNPVLYNRRGWNYLWLQKWEKAKDAFEKAIILDPGDAESYVNLADYWWAHKKDKKKALEYLEVSFRKGFDFWDDLYSDVWDGHFLKDLNNTPEFKDLVDKYKKPAKEESKDTLPDKQNP